MNFVKSRLPWIVAGLCLLYVLSLPFRHIKSEAKEDVETLGRLPVLADGRVKPLDSFARTTLLTISGKQTLTVDEPATGDVKAHARQIPAIEWYLEMLANPDRADDRRVFRIDHPELVSMLGVTDTKQIRFSLKEISPHLDKIEEQANRAQEIPRREQDLFQRSVLDLFNKLMTYQEVRLGRAPFTIAPMTQGEEWQPLAAILSNPQLQQQESTQAIVSLLFAAKESKPEDFNSTVSAYAKRLDDVLPKETRLAHAEEIFNIAQPFSHTAALYVLAFILACFGFLTRTGGASDWSRALARSAFLVIVLAFAVHTIGIAARVYLQGRPPVTNLYSSAIFIGWACIPLAVAAEWFARLGIGNAVASLIGFATLIVAHNLSTGGDTMQMMQAVLDSNFWLATHVVVITIGYSATFLGGFIAAGYLIFGTLTKRLGQDALTALPKMIYGVTCFACLTSFVGTVLGGIWADQSWGRFWGWDPKENGAALIVFIHLIILHARFGGMIKHRGMAVLAVFGNIVTAWSWFGTNMLGVGLHSYGFMDSAVFYLLAFAATQLAIMCLGFIPVARWKSIRAAETTPTTPGNALASPQT